MTETPIDPAEADRIFNALSDEKKAEITDSMLQTSLDGATRMRRALEEVLRACEDGSGIEKVEAIAWDALRGRGPAAEDPSEAQAKEDPPETPAAETKEDLPRVSDADIEAVITGMARSAEDNIRAMSRDDLEGYWLFTFRQDASIPANIYVFQDRLDMYRRKCRRWEEIHNGSCCVVERVRDRYLMPKIRDFADALHDRILREENEEKSAR